jgi:hypothetical protein
VNPVFWIQTLREIPIAIRIDIEVLFPKKLSLANSKTEVEIVWENICDWKGWEGINMDLSSFRSQKKTIWN